MTQNEIRQKVISFANAENIEEHLKYLDIFIQCYIDIIFTHHNDALSSKLKADAKMVFQMMTSKLIYLKKLTEGIKILIDQKNPIIDPIVVTCLVRNIYETVCMFNIVYDEPETDEKRKILYSLWVAAGLNYRQKFSELVTGEENQKKFQSEKNQIEQIEKEIEDTQTFKNLSEKNQNKIKTKLKEKDYKIKIEGDNVRFLHWQDISLEFCTKQNIFEEMYNYFSLYAHPSNVSVFQYADMFKPGEEVFKYITAGNIRFAYSLASVFLADFTRLFPETKSTFENRSIADQIILNFMNHILRGENKSINDAWKTLD